MLSPKPKPYGSGFPGRLAQGTGHLKLINKFYNVGGEKDGEGLILVHLGHEKNVTEKEKISA